MRNDLKAKQRQFVFDRLLDRQPVKRMKHRSNVGRSGCSENESCSIVLYFLEKKKKKRGRLVGGDLVGGWKEAHSPRCTQ